MHHIKKIIRAIRQWILYTYSLIISVLFGIRKHSKKVIENYKDKYKGQRCFIVGNGPSLTAEDLDKLKGEITFASNKIFKVFSKSSWRPTYYAIFDESVVNKEVIREVNKLHCEMKFFREQGYYKYKKIKDGYYIHSWHSRRYLKEPQFSCNILKGIYSIATVTYSLIQIAKYMGFEEIYLVGMDNRYAYSRLKDGTVVKNENVCSYFDGCNERRPSPKDAVSTWEMELAYDYAQQYARENNFRIFNATRGGFLEVFERKNFDEIMKGEMKDENCVFYSDKSKFGTSSR